MGYQALLFCPDEKLARIVAQVFSDLEFNVEPVQEPFSAVKKLMAQRYDALVVDCENESNASLLFKSARNSNFNQGTLAIAVVEGQAGVAKAYRIGANLVLTKPINVEQAKGTLRVARGLLRKSAEGSATTSHPVSSTAAPAVQVPAKPTTPVAPTSSSAAGVSSPARPTAPPKVARELPEFEPPTPAIAAATNSAQPPVAAASVQDAPAKSAPPIELSGPIVNPEPKEVVKPAALLPTALTTSLASAQGTAAAPAQAKEFAPAETKEVEFETVEAAFDMQGGEPVGSAPSFSALDLDQSSSSSGGSKKVLIAAVVLLAVAALGYFGWTKMGSHREAGAAVEQPVSAPPQQSSSTPAPAPFSAPSMTAPAPTIDHSGASGEPVNSKTSVSIQPEKSSNPPVIRIDDEPEVKTVNVAPLKVKSGGVKHAKGTADDTNAPVPNPLAVAEANSSDLSSLVASPSTSAKPSLATLKISQGVSQGLLIKRVDPKYPPSALAMHIQGAVFLDAIISREGKISNLTVVKGDKVLAHAATEAVRQWRYKPYYLNGQPVEIQTQITINFKLPN